MPTQKTDKSSALSFDGAGTAAKVKFSPLDPGRKLKATAFGVIV